MTKKSLQSEPLVSVIVPTYNSAEFLGLTDLVGHVIMKVPKTTRPDHFCGMAGFWFIGATQFWTMNLTTKI